MEGGKKSMKDLLIISAGGCGREVFQWAKDIQKAKETWKSIHFLDDNLQALDGFGLKDLMVGTIAGYRPGATEEVICALGDSVTRLNLCNDLRKRGASFANIIHPTALIADYSYIGTGVILCPGAIISTNVQIGDFVLIDVLSVAGHDVTIEQGSTLSDHCDLMGGAYLEEAAFLGSGARIFPTVRVGTQAKIGAGSVVIRDVPPNISVFGNPARQIY